MKTNKSIPLKKDLLKKRNLLLKSLGKYPFILRGSIRKQGNICGNPNCRCKDKKNPVLHGPYYYLSNRYQDKMQTLFLNDTKMKYAEAGIKNYDDLFHTVYELCYINFQLIRYYYKEKLL